MSKLNSFAKGVKVTLTKHSPEILTGMGVAGMFTTTVLAVGATPKALRLIDEKKEELETDKLTVKETVQTTWKCYIPAAITGVLSTACLVCASSVSSKRNAALATAYSLSETALREYREKVVETIGEKKEQVIQDKIAEDRVKKNPVTTSEVYITEKGNTLCYDPISDRYFKSDIERIKKAENYLNKQMLDGELYISLNEFYDEIGLKHTSVGDDIGWNIDKGFIDIHFGSCIADDGTPCIVIEHYNPPQYNFHHL